MQKGVTGSFNFSRKAQMTPEQFRILCLKLAELGFRMSRMEKRIERKQTAVVGNQKKRIALQIRRNAELQVENMTLKQEIKELQKFQ